MQTKSYTREDVKENWWLIDATGKSLGRLATQVATLIRGKHKAEFTPHADTGDFVVVINAEKVEMTGSKWSEKSYYRHTGYFGSLKETSAKDMRTMNPEFIIEEAVKGMLPKNKLARKLIKHLKAYKGTEHPHASQKPQAYTLN